MVGVVFVRKVIHLATNFFGSTVVNHVLAELFVSYEEHVGSGGSRFSESVLERWHSA